ncbi:hypothetical protein [Chromobacterium subtsugae]|uniref:hypothetical protein n=1 Tax=Chromobacterium subtsugae TaxID=251747 RepID=UPI000AC0C62E|nr:hypothetical protein [Chromobacterium subtsugae]
MSKTQTVMTFRDAAYKSRTLFLPDGRPLVVGNYTITTDDEAAIAYLTKHPDFKPEQAASE